MNADIFLDTNILIYAYDIDSGYKREIAGNIVKQGWENIGETAISVQVLQEFHVTLMRKGRDVSESTELVRDFFLWPVVENTAAILNEALILQQRYQISFWDSMILAAAKASGASILFTEDLNHNQWYDGDVRVVNPFIK
jgi:predicted nucleic acid-binding protein